jgi:hypothetical protein
MQPSLNVRRHNDGSIDFDFYRRSAARRRRRAKRMIIKRNLTAIGRAGQAGISAIAAPLALLWLRPGDLHLVLRTSAIAVAILLAAAALHAWA